MQIVERSGLSWAAVNTAIQQYKAEGDGNLKPASRGRKLGTGRILTIEHEAEICERIRKRRPWFYKLKDALWNRNTVMQLIDQKTGIKLPERSVTNYLHRWGIELNRSNKLPYAKCSKECKVWLDAHYADIERNAKDENAEIFWINKPVRIVEAIWWQKAFSEWPVSDGMMLKKKQQQLSMMSAVTNQGKVRWIVVRGAVNSDRYVQFIKGLIKDTRKKRVVLIFGDPQNSRTWKLMDKIRLEHFSKEVRVLPDFL